MHNKKYKIKQEDKDEQNKKLIQRGEVYMADLDIYKNDRTKHIQKGYRPCLVISNDKNNYHSGTFQIIPITAEMKKNLPTHVELFTDCGIDKPSIALAEGIAIISEDSFGIRLGKVSEVKMAEIESAIKIQLHLVETFSINYIENIIKNIKEIENKYPNNFEGIDKETLNYYNIVTYKLDLYYNKFKYEMDEYLRNCKDTIENYYNNKEYDKCIEYCNKHIDIVEYFNITYYCWYFNYVIGRCYRKLNKVEFAIKYINKSIEFTHYDEDIKYVHSLWILALCYKNLNNNKKAIELFEECLVYFYKYEMYEYVADTKFNLGTIQKDKDLILEAIKHRENLNIQNDDKLTTCYEYLNKIN